MKTDFLFVKQFDWHDLVTLIPCSCIQQSNLNYLFDVPLTLLSVPIFMNKLDRMVLKTLSIKKDLQKELPTSRAHRPGNKNKIK